MATFIVQVQIQDGPTKGEWSTIHKTDNEATAISVKNQILQNTPKVFVRIIKIGR